jgi:hypothetical protein
MMVMMFGIAFTMMFSTPTIIFIPTVVMEMRAPTAIMMRSIMVAIMVLVRAAIFLKVIRFKVMTHFSS